MLKKSLVRLRQKFYHKKESFIGIDIGTRNIKIVEVVPGNPPQIANLASIPTPSGALDDGTIVQIDPVAAAIKTVLDQSGIKIQKAVTMISGKNVVIRYIKLPKMNVKEVASTLKWEADKYIPISSGTDLILEHLVLGDADEDNPQTSVLLVGVPRRLIYQLNETFKLAGLDLLAVEIEPLSLWRSIGTNLSQRSNPFINMNEPFIGLDIGAKASNLTVFQGEKLKFSRYILQGGDALTRSVAQATGLEFNAAQVIKERDGELLTEPSTDFSKEKLLLDQVLKESVSALISEVRRSIDYYKSQFKIGDPKALILSGGTAKLKGLVGLLQSDLGIPVTLGLQNIGIKEKQADYEYNEVRNVDPAFAVAVGLAMREVTK